MERRMRRRRKRRMVGVIECAVYIVNDGDGFHIILYFI